MACGRSELGYPRIGAAGGAPADGPTATGDAIGAGGGAADASAGAKGTGGEIANGRTGGGGGRGGSAGAGGMVGSGGTAGFIFDAGGLTSCSWFGTLPIVDGCARPVGSSSLPPNLWRPPRSLALSGTVTLVGRGPVDESCLEPSSHSSADSVVLRVRSVADAGVTECQVEYRLPRSSVVWNVGDAIDVDYAEDGGGWTAVRSHLLLSRSQKVEVYVGRSSSLDQLQKAPIDWYRGADVCVEQESDFVWSYSKIDVKTATGWSQIHPGSTVQSRDYQITNGGVLTVLWRAPDIMDGLFPEVAVGVERLAR